VDEDYLTDNYPRELCKYYLKEFEVGDRLRVDEAKMGIKNLRRELSLKRG